MGYIIDFSTSHDEAKPFLKTIDIQLKYFGERRNRQPVITSIKRVSKPGRRVYVGKSGVPRVRNGLGLAVISTSRGILSDHDARAENVGGEVVCEVW